MELLLFATIFLLSMRTTYCTTTAPEGTQTSSSSIHLMMTTTTIATTATATTTQKNENTPPPRSEGASGSEAMSATSSVFPDSRNGTTVSTLESFSTNATVVDQSNDTTTEDSTTIQITQGTEKQSGIFEFHIWSFLIGLAAPCIFLLLLLICVIQQRKKIKGFRKVNDNQTSYKITPIDFSSQQDNVSLSIVGEE